MNTENGTLDYLENDWDACPVCDRHECQCPPETETDMQTETETNNNGGSAQPSEKADTLFVENRAQAAIYEFEMKGQMSDGRWENSRPMGHWRTPNEARVVVRPALIGRDFYVDRGYNFGEKELFEAVGERMTRYAKVALAFPAISIEALEAYRWDFDTNLCEQRGVYSADYQKRKDAQIVELLALVGVRSAEEFESAVAAVAYTEKNCRRDASRLTKCFRTQLENWRFR